MLKTTASTTLRVCAALSDILSLLSGDNIVKKDAAKTSPTTPPSHTPTTNPGHDVKPAQKVTPVKAALPERKPMVAMDSMPKRKPLHIHASTDPSKLKKQKD